MPHDASADAFHNFDLLSRVKVKYGDVVLSKWRSRVTGLTLVHIDYQGPSCSTLPAQVALTRPSQPQ